MTESNTAVRNKKRLLRLLRYLYEYTDEENPAKTSELAETICGENTPSNRRRIQADIQLLEEEGFDIETIRSYYHAFYMRSREFELPELKLLIDAVSSSRFVTRAKSEDLVRKLSAMASRRQGSKLVRQIYTPDRLKPGNENIYYIVDLITDAINEEKKVSFQYIDYTPAKQKLLRHDGAFYSVSPYALLWDDNHYYMIGYSDSREEINVYRVDRVNALGIKEETAVPKPADFDVDAYGQESVNMFFGEKQEVTLQCENDMMKSVIDQFGEEVETWVVDKAIFRAKVTVNVSQTFFAWVFQFRGRICIYGPEHVRSEYRAMLEKSLMQMSM
ncbi:YafY family protein [Eubacterium sp. AB3007]|uniref:helix-turn-helix transcriptional regulator n=1 Tax=Eubacterium sp. AB3007 TaxID=1392487 RepID=UPI0005572872|nr:WYL domain-containing protein [Eubacterium sp. AB3007]